MVGLKLISGPDVGLDLRRAEHIYIYNITKKMGAKKLWVGLLTQKRQLKTSVVGPKKSLLACFMIGEVKCQLKRSKGFTLWHEIMHTAACGYLEQKLHC